MRRLGYALLFFLAMCCGRAHAASVTLTLPDSQLRWAVGKVCDWHHCEAPENGGYKSDSEKAQWVADNLVQIISMNRLKGLADLSATLEIRHD